MMKDKILNIQNNVEELNRIVEFLETLQEEWDLPPALITSLNLVLEEAVSNVIFYAFENDTQHEITIEFSLEDNTLTIILKDDGKAYDPTQKEDPDINLSVEERPIGGLGIFLIKQIMDEVSYQRINNENQLTMIKKIK